MTIAPDYSQSDYRDAFLRCLPTGPVWPRDADAMPYQVASALLNCYATSGAAAAALLVDAFPSTTVNLLPEWESTLGLPDPCAGETPTLQQQQLQVTARFIDSGGSSIAYYVAFAESLGFQVQISTFWPICFGCHFGDLMYGEAWAFAWQVTATGGRTDIRVLLCELEARAPAHTALIVVEGRAVTYSAALGQFVLGINTFAPE